MTQLSIIIPSHNDSFYLEPLFTSILETMILPLDKFEVIVVNNGSTDTSTEVIKKYGFREIYLNQKLNPSSARNLGVSHSLGKLLVFLDSDVVVTKKWAEKILELVNKKECDNIFTGDYYHISRCPSRIEKIWFSNVYEKDHKYICGGNIVVSRKIFELVDGFTESLETGEDVDFSNKCSAIGYSPEFDNRLYVYHEGYPKNISTFIKREIWHGKSDFSSFNKFIKSKVAVLASFFAFLHFSFVFFLSINELKLSLLVLILILCCCIFVGFKNKALKRVKDFPLVTLISYSYLLGRALSFTKR